MADGRVNIDTRLETGNVRNDVQRVNTELGRIGNNMGRTAAGMRNEMGRGMQGMVGDSEYYARQYRRAYGNEIGGLMGDIGGSYRHMSAEARGMMMEMQQGFHAQRMAMLPFKEDQIKATYGFYQMAQGSREFQGTNQAFIGQANEIGKAMKASQDAQINGNRLAMMGILQTIGAMNAMSSAASKTTKNLDAMKNPLYNTARPALALVDSLDRVARSGSAAQIALELHGPQASMKTLTDETMRLNTILMGLPFLAIGVGASMMFMYGGLHKANMEMDPKYAETFKNMLEKITEALKPMRDAFTAVMVPIYKFVTKLAELTIAFNEAHPVMARFIQGTIMLVPALMALLLPLSLGVGYFRGLRAILFALRPIIMPVVTAFATMSAPVWITAAAIAGLTVGLTHFYKTNEKFKGFVDGTVSAVKNFSKALYQNGVDLVKAAYNSELVQGSIKKTKEAFVTAGNASLEFGKNTLTLGKYLVGVVEDGGNLNDWLSHLPDSWKGAAVGMADAIITMRTSMISLFSTSMQLGKDLMQLGSYLTNVALTGNIFSDALNALPPSVQGLASSFAPAMLAVNSFGQSLVALGKYFYFAALDGDNMNDFITHLPVSWQNAAMAVGNVIATMSTSFQSLFGPLNQIGSAFMNLGRYILSVASTGDLMNQWINSLPGGFQNAGLLIGQAVLTIKTAISSLVEAVRLALGGDTSQLGQIFMTILPTLIGMLLGGLPALLITASHFLPTIVNGINMMLPLLTSTITNIITGIVTVITTYLPQFLEQGIKILTFLINGVIQVLPVVVTTLVEVGATLINTLINTIGTLLPVILDAGIKILMAIIDGIVKSLPMIIDAGVRMVTVWLQAVATMWPKIIDAGIKILMALIDGIIKVLPNLIDTAVMLITKIADMLIRNLPMIIDAGLKILMALIDGIMKILPQLIQTAITLIVKIADTIMQNLPKIIAAGVLILSKLIEGIIKILPTLVSTAISLVVKIAQTIISHLPQILQAGAQILRMLIQGILSLIGQLLSTITSNVIGGIKNCFSNAGTMLTSIGKNIIQGLINGISSMVGSAVSAVKRVASNIKDGIADFFDIHSPSRLMYGMGEFVTEGLANGIVSLTNLAVKKAKTMAEAVADGFSSLQEDIVMGDIVGGGISSDALQSSFANSKRFINDVVDLPPNLPSIQQNSVVKAEQTRKNNVTSEAGGSAPTYIVMDKKVVGEVLAQPVESTNNRRKQRLAQFKPTVTPSF
ncbi:phage tail protein [Bacillus mycoides]|uniref:phage tail protein n=1 Tax=Bacillus mycoides TaxID=1405 RepID=UPI0011EDD0C5|nr:carbamoyl-phosphate synthase large subunit [Bacillus mycoides]QEL88485.1 carbamoyl-phosphate synthase large subunit [Bacillus mycoides]